MEHMKALCGQNSECMLLIMAVLRNNHFSSKGYVTLYENLWRMEVQIHTFLSSTFEHKLNLIPLIMI